MNRCASARYEGQGLAKKELGSAQADFAQARAETVRGAALAQSRPGGASEMAGLGLLPAALSHGIGSETQRPFAVVIVGGIISATTFTLLLLPILYRYFEAAPAPE